MKAACAVLSSTGVPAEPVQICVVLSDDDSVAYQNKQWRGKDKPTNVLSFPVPDIVRKKGFLGDIIMSFEALEREAMEQEKTLQNHALHLFVHGLLHLLGYEHEKDEEAQLMEGLETKILLELGLPDPYE